MVRDSRHRLTGRSPDRVQLGDQRSSLSDCLRSPGLHERERAGVFWARGEMDTGRSGVRVPQSERSGQHLGATSRRRTGSAPHAFHRPSTHRQIRVVPGWQAARARARDRVVGSRVDQGIQVTTASRYTDRRRRSRVPFCTDTLQSFGYRRPRPARRGSHNGAAGQIERVIRKLQCDSLSAPSRCCGRHSHPWPQPRPARGG